MSFNAKHLLGIEQLSVDQIQLILETAKSLREISTRPIKKVPTLRGQDRYQSFLSRPLTRTRTSFEIAAKRLSADAINISTSSSSIVKGETLVDTARNLEGHGPGRHRDSTLFGRSPPINWLEAVRPASSTPVTGPMSIPLRRCWTALTILDHKPALKGLRVAIIGETSPTAGWLGPIVCCWGRWAPGVMVCGPPTLLPVGFERMGQRTRIADRDRSNGRSPGGGPTW